MEVFALLLLVVLVIVAGAFVFFRWFKKPTVEDVGLHYGEKMLFDDDKCSVELPAGPGLEPLGDVFVRVTNKRIIIGLGGKRKHLLKYIVYYDTIPGKASGGSDPGKKGYVLCTTEPSKVSYPAEETVRIEPATPLGTGVPEWLQIKTNHIANYREAFRS